MDITEYVKRNNFAVAQYEVWMRCAAQNCHISNDTTRSPLALPNAHRSRSIRRIAVPLSDSRIIAKPSRPGWCYPRKLAEVI
jgi:hypothetical protein